MAVLSASFLLVFFFFLSSVRLDAAEHPSDDVIAYQQTENDVTQSPSVKSYDVDGGAKAKFLNVLERKLKTFSHQKQLGGGGGEGRGVGRVPQSSGATEAKRRSWAENSMYAWGKRRPQSFQLGEQPRFKRSVPYMRRMGADGGWGGEASLVGKGRVASSEDSNEDTREEEEEEEEGQMGHQGRERPYQHKRRWSDHSMNAWGKRQKTPIDLSDEEGASGPYHPPPPPPPPKDDTSNQIYLLLLLQHHRDGVEKRNWATNTMDVWGKRSTPQIRDDAQG